MKAHSMNDISTSKQSHMHVIHPGDLIITNQDGVSFVMIERRAMPRTKVFDRHSMLLYVGQKSLRPFRNITVMMFIATNTGEFVYPEKFMNLLKKKRIEIVKLARNDD